MTKRPQPRPMASSGVFWPYLALTAALCPLIPLLMRRRLRRGKEDPARWREKLGHATLSRPAGPLIWLHAVGLGETLALRGLLAALRARRPDAVLLVTSSTRGSAESLARNPVAGVLHQFAPLDCPLARARFLAHWRPSVVVWSEQDIWPGLVHAVARAGVPQVWINARMNAAAQARRARARRLMAAVQRCFVFITAQDDATARNISLLGGTAEVAGALKAAAPPLAEDAPARAAFATALGPRRVWLLASSHAEDEETVRQAVCPLPADRLLIVAPRDPARGTEVAEAFAAAGLTVLRRSQSPVPQDRTEVYIADSLGEMGLWYRLAEIALVGGGFSDIEGHNPWEAILLGCPVLHGPRTANFARDYADLDAIGAARGVTTAADLRAALLAADRTGVAEADTLAEQARAQVVALAHRIAALLAAEGAPE